MPTFLRHIEAQAFVAWRFVKLDMWRLTRDTLSAPARLGVATLRVLYMTVQAYIEEGIGSLAGSLTYSTALSLVPILAVIVGIAKGFGLQETVRDSLMRALPGHEMEFEKAFGYVENYLSQVQGGLFIGVGLAALFYTVLLLISTIEDAFNRLWQAPYARPWSRRVINYLGAFILFPLLLTISSGTTLFLSTLSNTYLGELGVISTVTTQVLALVPYIVVTLGFVGLYLFLPNVRVHFVPALIAGLITGVAFQIFQALYINGVLWISRYNAIYGSFAAVPLALLWIQLSWIIILLGAQISYSIQHVWHFTTPPNSRPLSRRYADTVFITLMAHITARYTSDDPEPYRAETLAAACDLPLRQTQEALSQLTRMGVLIEVKYGKDEVIGGYYCPNISPERLTLGLLLEHIDRYGGELLSLKRNGIHATAWQARTHAYDLLRERMDVLLRDLV